MKVILFNGSPNKEGSTYLALKIIEEELKKEGIETEIIWFGNGSFNDCIGCKKCYEIKKCVFDDGVNELVEKCRNADGFIFGSPTYYSHPTGRILSYLDRMFYSGKEAFSYKPCASISVARRAGNIMTYDVLNKYAGISNMIIVSSCYWNMAFSKTKEDLIKDFEGIDTLKGVGLNLAYILKLIELGKKNNINHPEIKKRSTNFIR